MTEKQFVETYCHNCGTQRCEGVGTEWFEGCKYKWSLDGREIEATSEIHILQQKNLDLATKILRLQEQISKEKVKHGYWIDLNIAEWQCSECNYRVERWNNTPYCPDCGTKMDGGK